MDRITYCRGGVLPRRPPGVEGGEPPWTMEEPGPTDIWPPRRKPPRRGRRDTSTEKGLTEVREAHWWVLSTVATLEEEKEQLSQSVTRGWLDAHAHSRSWDCCRWKSRGQKRRHHPVQLEESHAPYFKYHSPWKGPESKEDEEALLDFNLEALLELGPEVNCFLWGPAESLGEEDRRTSSPEPPVEELESWVTWRAWMHNMPGWWQELAEVPGVDDYIKLAWEVWASFLTPTADQLMTPCQELPSGPTSTAVPLLEEFSATA